MSEKIYTAADSLLVQQQATIERLTEQRDRLLGCIKAQNEREKEYLAVMHKLPRNYYFTNQSDALIAEIEASND